MQIVSAVSLVIDCADSDAPGGRGKEMKVVWAMLSLSCLRTAPHRQLSNVQWTILIVWVIVQHIPTPLALLLWAE